MIKVILPLYIDIPRKTKKDKRYYLNINGYRNWCYIVNNQIKKKFKNKISSQLIFKLNKPKIEYKLFYKDKRNRDKMNIITVIDKFFMDALVESNCFKDDNDKNTGEVIIRNPEIDKENPRCEVTLYNEKI